MRLLQLTIEVWLSPAPTDAFSAFVVDVLLVVTSPPTTRPQMPPPGEFGGGFAGAETNALPCCAWKAVVALLRSAAMMADVVAAMLPGMPAAGPTIPFGG